MRAGHQRCVRQETSVPVLDLLAGQLEPRSEFFTSHALDELLDAGKRAGTVRPEVGALDVMMMVKGVCAAASALGDAGLDAVDRHVDLICAAISTPAHSRPLRGATPTLASLELLGQPEQPADSQPHDAAGASAARG